jgi:hypothetical protein
MNVYRKTIYSLAERYRLPTIYPYRFFVIEGGLPKIIECHELPAPFSRCWHGSTAPSQ